MHTTRDSRGAVEGQIWARLLRPGNGTFPKAAAQAILGVNSTDDQKARMHDLAQRNGEGKLSPSEREDLESYIHVANVLALLHAKARRSLKQPSM